MYKPIILCVDDERVVLSSLKEQLRLHFSSEFIIETAESASEAIEIIDEAVLSGAEITMIITDYLMPETKGDELLKTVHEKHPEIIKILLTGQATLEGVINSINSANLYRYISKPWQKEDLYLTVSEGIKSFYMNKELKEKNQMLMEINKNLEKLVEERTKELEKKNEMLQMLAQKDGLTDLLNHKAIWNSLRNYAKEAIENQDKLSVIMFDIDLFKKINDCFGHQAGDRVIYEVAKVVKSSVECEKYVGRYGGEEFLVLLPGHSLDEAYLVAERIRKEVEEMKFNESDLKVTISGGVAEMKDEDISSLIKVADKLLYKAKNNGRNKIIMGKVDEVIEINT